MSLLNERYIAGHTLSESEALVKLRLSLLLSDNASFVYVAYAWPEAGLNDSELKQLKALIAAKSRGSVVTYTDIRLSSSLLQQMAVVGISDVFYADLCPQAHAPACLTLRPAPAVGKKPKGQCWLHSGIQFARVLSSDAASSLWFCVENGIVPVLSLQKLTLPGPVNLWQAATIDCSENRTANNRIDAVIAAAATDKAFIDAKLAALAQLKFMYGTACFVYDILRLAASDKHYVGDKLQPLGRYIAELRLGNDVAQRRTLLLLIKTALLVHKDSAAVALQFSPLQLDFCQMLLALSASERRDFCQFAQTARLDWLSELLNAQ